MSWSSRGCQSVPQCQSGICSGLVGIPQFVSITHCVHIGDGSQIRVSYGQLLGSDSWLTAAFAIRQLGSDALRGIRRLRKRALVSRLYSQFQFLNSYSFSLPNTLFFSSLFLEAQLSSIPTIHTLFITVSFLQNSGVNVKF